MSAGVKHPEASTGLPVTAVQGGSMRVPEAGLVPTGTGQMRVERVALEGLLLSRTYLYTLFHKSLGAAPSEELLDALLGSATSAAVGEYVEDDAVMRGFGRFLEDLAAREDRAALLEQARDEYTRLFVGPGTLPVCSWESSYRTNEKTLFQENTLVVRALYRAYGLEPKRIERVPDDQVALLCAFMMQRSASALFVLRTGDFGAFSLELRDEHAFLGEHLTNWLGEFSRQARASKTAVLYPQSIEALAAFASVDETFLAEAAFWAENLAEVGAAPDELEVAQGSDDAAAQESDVTAAYAALRDALASLRSVRPFGVEDYELVPTSECVVNERDISTVLAAL